MPRLCLITALPAETRPLLDALKLRQTQVRQLRMYGADNILLLETGIGKLNAAAGAAAMLQHYPDITAIVNIGIAGGRFDYAQTLLAHHVKDMASGAQWYPHIPGHPAFKAMPTASISTVDAPDTNYASGTLFDMEAAGVFSAATRYLSTSQIHSVKVVSDNDDPDHSITHIDKQSVKTLIHDAIPVVRPLIDALLTSCAHHEQTSTVDDYVDAICKRVSHSVNDRQQLLRLVQQHVGKTGNLPDIDNKTDSAKNLRQCLRTLVDSINIIYGNQ